MTCGHNNHTEEARIAILDNIEKYGCHIIFLEPTDCLPGFAYTIGLYERFRKPEIICFGLNQDVLGSVLNDACHLTERGKELSEEVNYPSFLDGSNVQFLNVQKSFYPNYVGYGMWFYGGINFPLRQLVWPDKEAKFPWEAGFNPNWKFKQPLLDRGTTFKFYEERNAAVFTTKQVFEGRPIIRVSHDGEGDWQFHSEAEPQIEDAKVVCLEEITKIDPSINELFDLEIGWYAWRKSGKDDWMREQETIL